MTHEQEIEQARAVWFKTEAVRVARMVRNLKDMRAYIALGAKK